MALLPVTDLRTDLQVQTTFFITTVDCPPDGCSPFSRYIKIDKFNIQFRFHKNIFGALYLHCHIHDEKFNLLHYIKKTVILTISKVVNGSGGLLPLTNRGITGTIGHIAEKFYYIDLPPTTRVGEQFHIRLYVAPPQETLKAMCDCEKNKGPSESPPQNTWTRMYDDELFLDFKLVVKRSSEEAVAESVGFHRVVLSAWSPVMMNMLTSDWKEKNEGVLELPVTLEVLQAFKKYIYTDQLPNTTDRETLLGLAELGSYYMDPKLETGASKAIFELIHPEEMVETMGYSIANKLHELTKLLFTKIRTSEKDNFDQVINSIN